MVGKIENAAQKKIPEPESEIMLSLDRYLTDLKAEADALYDYTVRKEHPDFRVRIIGATGKNEKYPLATAFDTLRFFIRLSKEFKDDFDPDRPQDLSEEEAANLLKVWQQSWSDFCTEYSRMLTSL